MATDRKKLVMKEIGLWKKRFNESKRVFGTVAKDVQKDVNRIYKDVSKEVLK